MPQHMTAQGLITGLIEDCSDDKLQFYCAVRDHLPKSKRDRLQPDCLAVLHGDLRKRANLLIIPLPTRAILLVSYRFWPATRPLVGMLVEVDVPKIRSPR